MSTQRLPIPGKDNGTWGSILNGFLQVAHNADGTLSKSAITSAGAITSINNTTTTTGSVNLTAGSLGITAASIGAASVTSPAFSGAPTAPTAAANTNTTQLATTAFANAAVAVETNRAETAEATKQAGPLTGDVTTSGAAATVVGTSNVESIIRANSLDQFAQPAANVSFNSKQLTQLGSGITSTSAPNLGQLAGNQYAYVVSGCGWTVDSPGSTLNASMTAGMVMIGGILLSVAAITAHSFTASSDTYVDFANNGDGTANVTYTVVPNNTISPALASSGTMLNTIRDAVIVSGATALTSNTASVLQGAAPSATTQFSTTVAAGSNGNAISSSTLSLASGTGVPTGGGWAKVAHAAGQTYTISFTGISGAVLQGVTVISGTTTLTVSTGDTVSGITPLNVTDMLGNIIYPSSPYPHIIAQAGYLASFTVNYLSNSTTMPLAGLVAPFIIPAGPTRAVKISVHLVEVVSSAVAGTFINVYAGAGNAGTFSSGLTVGMVGNVSASNDGWPMFGSSVTRLAPGSYTAQVGVITGAAGLVIGSGFNGTYVMVELV